METIKLNNGLSCPAVGMRKQAGGSLRTCEILGIST